MSRELTSHKVNGLNEAIKIEVLDEPGQGNACHEYVVVLLDQELQEDETFTKEACRISFQNGPIKENGVNGISNEALLGIVEDRLAGFQSGQFACRENAIALTHVQDAMMWLQRRTRARMQRGVEGTNIK